MFCDLIRGSLTGWNGIGAFSVLGMVAWYYMLCLRTSYISLQTSNPVLCNWMCLGGCSESTVPRVEATNDSLGHRFSVGVGLALSAKIQRLDSRVYMIVGDGELGEGSNWEASMCASKHKLSNLTVIVDYNKLQCSGPTHRVSNFGSLAEKFTCSGFLAQEVDGHDLNALKRVFQGVPYYAGRPSAVICHTVMSKGLPYAENDAEWHWKNNLD